MRVAMGELSWRANSVARRNMGNCSETTMAMAGAAPAARHLYGRRALLPLIATLFHIL